MSAVIGQVSQQTGTFVRIGTDGKEQLLHAGDKIHKGDKVIAKEGEALTVTLSNDEVIKLDKNSPVTFDASIIGDELFTKEDVSSEELTLDQVLEGASIDADAVGETAAGQGNQSYVSGATTIDRIGESGDAKAQTSSSEFEASSQSTKPQANALSFVDSVENAQALNGANEQNPEVPNSEDPTTSINIEGSNSDDTLLGTADDDTILGNQGNDKIIAGEGNDTISGGEGSDIINAGSGNDTIAGDAGDDLIQGGAGNDLIEGGTGADTISGDLGDDILLGGSGSDTISGGDGNDTIQGGDDNDTLIGGDGQDILLGEAGDDTISGNNGDDTLNGGTGEDAIFGGEGNDTIDGGSDNDLLLGDSGDDIIYGGSGDDTLSGGTGADILQGDEGNDQLLGGAGDDFLSGGSGDDTLVGGSGDDIIDGGLGQDTLILEGNRDDYTIIENSNGSIIIINNDTQELDLANDVENFQFADQTLTAEDLVDSNATENEAATLILDSATTAVTQATQNLEQAQDTLTQAQTQQTTLDLTDPTQLQTAEETIALVVEEATHALNEANRALEQAQIALESAQEALDAANANGESIQEELTRLQEAQDLVDTATQLVADATQTLENANQTATEIEAITIEPNFEISPADNTPTITGQAEVGSTVIILIDGIEAASAEADENGNWTYTTDLLSEGDHTVQAIATDEVGNSVSSPEMTITVDTQAATAPETSDITFENGSMIITGNATDVGSTIQLRNAAGDVVGSTAVEADGSWNIDITDYANENVNTNQFFTVTETDSAGNESLLSQETHFANYTWSNAQTDDFDDYAFAGEGNDTLHVNDNDLNDHLVVDGGNGTDRVIFNGALSDYAITHNENSEITITELASTDSNGDGIGDVTVLRNVEEIQVGSRTYTTDTLLDAVADAPLLDINLLSMETVTVETNSNSWFFFFGTNDTVEVNDYTLTIDASLTDENETLSNLRLTLPEDIELYDANNNYLTPDANGTYILDTANEANSTLTLRSEDLLTNEELASISGELTSTNISQNSATTTASAEVAPELLPEPVTATEASTDSGFDFGFFDILTPKSLDSTETADGLSVDILPDLEPQDTLFDAHTVDTPTSSTEPSLTSTSEIAEILPLEPVVQIDTV